MDHLYSELEEPEQGALAQLLRVLETRDHNVENIAGYFLKYYYKIYRILLVSSNYNGWKDTLHTIHQAYQLCAALRFFGMKSLDSRPTKHQRILTGSWILVEYYVDIIL